VRELFFRWLKLDVQNLIPEVWWAVGIIWALLLAFALASIWGQSFGSAARIFWTLLVTLIPVAGLLLYCIFCLLKVDYHFLERFVFFQRRQPMITASKFTEAK